MIKTLVFIFKSFNDDAITVIWKLVLNTQICLLSLLRFRDPSDSAQFYAIFMTVLLYCILMSCEFLLFSLPSQNYASFVGMVKFSSYI